MRTDGAELDNGSTQRHGVVRIETLVLLLQHSRRHIYSNQPQKPTSLSFPGAFLTSCNFQIVRTRPRSEFGVSEG